MEASWDFWEQAEQAIAQADAAQAERILNAVLQRYHQLYPNWEISTLALEKGKNRSSQIDGIIAMLQRIKAEA